jgi:hypothetical protein
MSRYICIHSSPWMRQRCYENILMKQRNITLAIGMILIITSAMVNATFAAFPPTQEVPPNGAVDLPTTVTVR